MKNNPFSGLRQQMGLPEASSTAAPATPAPDSGLGTQDPGPIRAVVRYERTGRGGKDATIIEQLGLPPAELDVWLKALKASLGCGGSIEGAAIMLQGDHRKRLVQVLTARGVRKVIVG
ncbi:MAG: translation initiation factor [Acidobacteria bacterium]|nr:translation initiation factor [Acidobacteriota bacterium]